MLQGHVARRINPAIAGPQEVVHVDAFLRVVSHPGHLEIELLDVGNAPDSHEDLIHRNDGLLVIAHEMHAPGAVLEGDFRHFRIEIPRRGFRSRNILPQSIFSCGMTRKTTLPTIENVFVPDERKIQVRRRLNRARGQVDGIERMLSENRPCAEILQQIAAAQEALRGAGKLMVRNYMENCATEGIKAGREKEVYDEFLDLIYRMVR